MSDQTSLDSSSRNRIKEKFVAAKVLGRGPYENISFVGCYFEGCRVGPVEYNRERPLLKNITLTNCEVRGTTIGAAIVEDCLVDGLKTNGLFQAWAPALRHVTLRGRIGRIMISDVHSTVSSAEEVAKFKRENRHYYESVDWALDIRDAHFTEADLRGVPGTLVVRDPKTQVLVRRERLLDGRWRGLDLASPRWPVSLQLLLDSGLPSKVLVAPRGDPAFDELVRGLRILQDSGIADPD